MCAQILHLESFNLAQVTFNITQSLRMALDMIPYQISSAILVSILQFLRYHYIILSLHESQLP